jgi:hypothetical protein
MYKHKSSNGSVNTILITDYFPLQKWVCVIISVDNNTIDGYIDGKMAISYTIPSNNGLLLVPTSGLQIGTPKNNTDDIIVTHMLRWPYPMDPQTAWNYYLFGPGNAGSNTSHVNLTLMKNNYPFMKTQLY